MKKAHRIYVEKKLCSKLLAIKTKNIKTEQDKVKITMKKIYKYI